MGVFAILLIALAPTISQVAASLWHGNHHGQAHVVAMQPDAHAGHASHAAPVQMDAHASHGAYAPETRDAPPEDCWSACGYCDLFNHVPALDLPGCGELVAADLPAPAIDTGYHDCANVAQRRSARPRGPPLPLA